MIDKTSDLIRRLFAAGHNETLSTGALYLEAAEALETKDMELGNLVLDKIRSERELRAEIERLEKRCTNYRSLIPDGMGSSEDEGNL